jgi:hypothetical protein
MRFDDSDETGLAAGHAARAANDKVFSRMEGAAASMREAANDRHASDGPHPAPFACTANAGAPACGLSAPAPV